MTSIRLKQNVLALVSSRYSRLMKSRTNTYILDTSQWINCIYLVHNDILFCTQITYRFDSILWWSDKIWTQWQPTSNLKIKLRILWKCPYSDRIKKIVNFSLLIIKFFWRYTIIHISYYVKRTLYPLFFYFV